MLGNTLNASVSPGTIVTVIGPKATGTLRVLVLGDSFAFGVGAQENETYPVRLQEVLRSRGVRAEVLNAGAPGYGVPDETAWFARWGKPLAPDVVLVTVFIGNDLQDAVPGPKPMAVDGALVMPFAAAQSAATASAPATMSSPGSSPCRTARRLSR